MKYKISHVNLNENIIRDAFSSLDRARNLTSKDVPIRRLPPELLSRVFVLVTSSNQAGFEPKGPRPGCGRSALILSSVCHRWRQVAIQTRELWSHIDIGVANNVFNGCIHLMLLYLDRAGNAPLDVHVYAGRTRQLGILKEAIDPLTRRVAQFRSLNIASYSATVLAFFVDLWLNDDSSRPLNALVLFRQWSSFETDKGCAFPSRRPSLERTHTLLTDVRILKLHDTYLDWDLATFRGLVELELCSIAGGSGPTAEQLFNLISVNPELRYIHVERVTIHAMPDCNISPVKMSKLETLEIGAGNLIPLLDLLEPCSSNFRLKLLGGAYDFSQEESIVLEGFCSRANLATLYIEGFGGDSIADLVVKILTLKTLVLDNIRLTEYFFRIMANPPNTTSPIEERFPSSNSALRILSLRDCEVEPSGLRELVTARPIKRLEVLRCNLPKHLGRHYSHGSPEVPEELPTELRDWLQDNVPRLHFTTIRE